MALVPFSYNLRSLFVRRSATFLTVLGVGATVAVVAGVLALNTGFESLFRSSGRSDFFIFLRPGATNETDSFFDRERANILMKSRPEIAVDADGVPLASIECYLALRRNRVDGGETNVPVRGVQPQSRKLNEGHMKLIEGRWFEPGSDEVIIGRATAGRFENCSFGDTLVFNTTPFKVVGIFDSPGPFASEIWGDLERVSAALQRPASNRVVAALKPGTDIAALRASLESDAQTPAQLLDEREYMSKQTEALSGVLVGLGIALAVIMGIAAVFTATNTMLAALAARTHEIGILLSIGFRPFSVFVSFLFESLLIALLGGAIGCVLILPLNGIQTSTMNFATFTDVSFAFRVTPELMSRAILFALLLGLLGGAWPAFRAAMMKPTEALRRR